MKQVAKINKATQLIKLAKSVTGTTGIYKVAWIYDDGEYILESASTYPNPECYTNNPLPVLLSLGEISNCDNKSDLLGMIQTALNERQQQQ